MIMVFIVVINYDNILFGQLYWSKFAWILTKILLEK